MHEMSNYFLMLKNPNIDKIQTEKLRVKNPVWIKYGSTDMVMKSSPLDELLSIGVAVSCWLALNDNKKVIISFIS